MHVIHCFLVWKNITGQDKIEILPFLQRNFFKKKKKATPASNFSYWLVMPVCVGDSILKFSLYANSASQHKALTPNPFRLPYLWINKSIDPHPWIWPGCSIPFWAWPRKNPLLGSLEGFTSSPSRFFRRRRIPILHSGKHPRIHTHRLRINNQLHTYFIYEWALNRITPHCASGPICAVIIHVARIWFVFHAHLRRAALVGAWGAEVELLVGVEGAAEVKGPDGDCDCDAVGHLYGGEVERPLEPTAGPGLMVQSESV